VKELDNLVLPLCGKSNYPVNFFFMKTVREIQSYSMIFSLKEDGIMEISKIPGWNDTPTLAHAQKDMECISVLSEGKKYPHLCYLPDVVISREMREFYASHEPVSAATALIVKSIFQRILGNFFLGMNKVKVPVKLFGDETEARQWLSKYKTDVVSPRPLAVFAE
jgi:hypothetical protein